MAFLLKKKDKEKKSLKNHFTTKDFNQGETTTLFTRLKIYSN
jgi:hypothetical protein